jgi:hypothetical protein
MSGNGLRKKSSRHSSAIITETSPSPAAFIVTAEGQWSDKMS